MNQIRIENLNYAYPNATRLAIRDINLTINAGERIAVVGGNGAGKSTLLLHFNGLLRGQGKFTIDELEINHQNLKEIRRKVGFVFQDPDDQLFMPTVEEDVRFGLMYQNLTPEIIVQKSDEVFHVLDIEDLKYRAPYHLSGGEKRLVALATVLVLEPSVLIFDEPTAGLDPKARHQLIHILDKRHETQIITTHDLEFAVLTAKRVLVMHDGKIVADGTITETLGNYQLMDECDLEVPHILHSGEHKHN